MSDPGNWHWRDGRIEQPGEAVVFDMDGVLSDAVGRQHFIEEGRRNWDAFFDACGEDAVIGAGSVVTRPVPAGTIAAGNPCRALATP